ncbi:radical SAM protein [Candidatus Aminicenantes bacterium AH-873-B07]|nr:radical SAM protein [Candidatus Aminicenantes bacterium AH-873-B07]
MENSSELEEQRKNPSIGFYGGEPLLKFDLLRQIIDYIKSIKTPKKYRYSLTTNGTLLFKEVTEYFVKNNVSITISLDGPKNIHNRYRVFSNGRRTFNVIMKNLKKIKKYSSEYFENNISFNVVLAPPYDFESIITFFYRNPLFEGIGEKFNFTFVDAYETTFFKDFNLENDEKNKYKEIIKLRRQYKNALIEGNYENLTIEKKLFNNIFYNIDYRGMELLPKKYPPQDTCFPGKRRLFVNVSGKFFMCERVGSNYEIGNIDNGFNYKRIYNFFEKYVEFFKDCKYCWALRLCNKCFNSIRKGENFDEQRKNKLCVNKLYNIEKNLMDYCEIREKNINAFKVFDNIKVM